MNSSDLDLDIEEVVEEQPTSTLFPGDSGELGLETRKVLIHLLSGPSIENRRHSNLWNTLIRDEEIIRSRLNELFLELVIDHDLQVGFTRQADTAELEVPKLLKRSPLTFIDSGLILFLRQQLAQAEVNSERAVLARSEIIEHMSLYERSTNTDRAGFVKRVNASIEKFKKHNILQAIRGSKDRFEISPSLKLIFSAEEISGLAALYSSLLIVDTDHQESISQTGSEESEDE